jgi:DNA-binding transcriptional MerR regulator
MAFTALQAARLAGCTGAQLEYWERCGLVVPRADDVGGPYSFRDLVALRMVRSLLEAGLPLARIRRAVSELVAAGEDIAGLRMVTDGDRVWACRDDGQILDALRHGQLALFVAVDRIAAAVEADVREFARDRQSFVEGLRGFDHPAGSR